MSWIGIKKINDGFQCNSIARCRCDRTETTFQTGWKEYPACASQQKLFQLLFDGEIDTHPGYKKQKRDLHTLSNVMGIHKDSMVVRC